MVATGQDSEAALDFRYWFFFLLQFASFLSSEINACYHGIIVQGRSCRPVARRGKSFTTLETFIAHGQIWSWWSGWTGTWCSIFICSIFIFSYLRRDQKWHAWNGALPTKTSLQLALDHLTFFTPTCQVAVIGMMKSVSPINFLIWTKDILQVHWFSIRWRTLVGLKWTSVCRHRLFA